MARKYTTDEVCDLMKTCDHEMEEYIFSGSDDELDAEVLEELDAREMEDMLVGANVILGNDTDYSSDNDSYVGDYASKIGGNDSDKESNANDRNDSDRESITCSDMSFQSSGSRGKEHSYIIGCGGHRRSGGGRGHGRGCHRARCRRRGKGKADSSNNDVDIQWTDQVSDITIQPFASVQGPTVTLPHSPLLLLFLPGQLST